jgi:hypothetical protein
MKTRARVAVAASSIVLVAALAGALSVDPAGARGPRIGPKQSFDGHVNGRSGSKGPVALFVDCKAPVFPGQTGHPVAGQTVGVSPAVATGDDSGLTGDSGTTIEAFFGPPPPGARPAGKSTVSFRRYGVAKPIPSAILLPCSGTGQVTFMAFPRTPPSSRPAIVSVVYVAQS